MRIIAGTHRGRLLPAKVHEGVRPTLDATRESIFNMLGHRFHKMNPQVHNRRLYHGYDIHMLFSKKIYQSYP